MVEGASGDVIQSTPVFRKLKEEGYHVTLNCTPPAPEILKHSPYVDECIVQIRDYVENKGDNLKNYWLEIAKSYDKFVNLTGAAEDTLLIADKYIFTLTGRRDGSSVFGANHKWAFFPSGAFAWRIGNEGFMQGQSLFSDLKLRVSYGKVGNQAVSPYQSLSRLGVAW